MNGILEMKGFQDLISIELANTSSVNSSCSSGNGAGSDIIIVSIVMILLVP